MIHGVPVGTVCAYAGPLTPSSQGRNNLWSNTSCAPGGSGAAIEPAAGSGALIEAQGWLPCDGRYLGVAQYHDLFRVLGYHYGESTDGTGQKTFRIPDYRGLFLRGVDDGAGLDPDSGKRTGPRGSGTAGDVGSLQCDALQDHQHDYDAVKTATPAKEGSAGAFTTSPKKTSSPDPPARVSSETRPKNIAVRYIIKYR